MSTADVLRDVWLFSGLDEQQLDAVSSLTFQKKFGPGELIVEEGRTGNGLYAIISGNVEAVKALGRLSLNRWCRKSLCHPAVKPVSLCVPSHRGFIAEAPHRHRVTLLRVSSGCPSLRSTGIFPETHRGPSGMTVTSVGSSGSIISLSGSRA